MDSNRKIISEAIEICSSLEIIENEIIYDVRNFTRELERAKLMTPELKNFIEDYMRWDNE